MRETTDLLNAPSTCIGVCAVCSSSSTVKLTEWLAQIKSSPGDPDVQMRPIPNSKYAFHLGEKGLESHCIYCSDFVHAKTREPINSFQAFPEHELWECPPTNDPLSFVTSSRKRTLETAYGIPQDEVLLGEKKFAASEGTSVTHVDLGMRHVLFDVPLGQPHGARRDWMIP